MTTRMVRQGEPKGLLGWPKNPYTLTNQNLRLCVKVNARGRSQLDLSHRGMVHIPQQVFQFPQLDILTLSHNHLDQLPPMISYLRGIRTLHLQHNLLTALPPTLVNCRHLAELDLTHNRLVSLPKGVGGLRALRVLKLGENQLEQVPHELGFLTNLRVMDLHSNRLWYIPFSLQNLYCLLRLDLSENLFDQIPMVVTKLTWLRALDVSRNRLATLPPDFDQLRELRELNLSENRFVALGVMVTKLRLIKYLSLSHNRLQFLPEQVSQMKNLRVLHLKDNCLEALPEKFPQLKYLNAAENKLTYFSVLHMPELVALDASANQLVSLPRGLFQLKQLQRLNLAQNQITEVPEDIGWLKKLQTLDLSENDLHSLPASLHFLDKLTSFNVRGNHKLSRSPLKNLGEEKLKPEEKNGKKSSSKPSKHQAGQKNEGKHTLQKCSSMPSLHHPLLSKNVSPDQPMTSKVSSDHLPGGQVPPPQERTWLDNFLLPKPRHRSSWDANMTPQMARSVPYPTDELYETGEIHASFSAENLTQDNTKLHSTDPRKGISFHSDDEDSALEASFSSNENLTPHHNTDGHNARLMNHSGPHTPSSHGKPKKSIYTTSKKSAAVSGDDQTHKKIPYLPTTIAEDQTNKKISHLDNAGTVYQGNSFNNERKLPYTSECHLGVYDYHESEGNSSEPRQMNILLTNLSQPSSQHSTVRSRNQTTSHKQNRGTQILRSDSNWTMRSHLSGPLTIQTWTQTGPPEQYIHAGTQTRSLSPSAANTEHQNFNSASAFTGLRSPDSPPMLTSMGGYSQRRQDFPGRSQGSLLQPDSMPSSSFFFQPAASDLKDGRTRGDSQTNRSTDYTLLGVCNQIQTQLHRDLLQPVIGYNGQRTGRFSNKNIQPGHNGAWHWGQNPAQGSDLATVEAGLEYSPGETFTTTERGGHYVSAFCPHLQVSVPPGAVDQTLHVTLQQLTVSNHVLKAIGRADSYVSNLISVGPIIFLHSLEKVTFASPVTLTLPAPVKVKGQQGHLVVVSVRGDNTCVPCTTGYQSSRREVTLTTWHMTGKVAVLCKAKCKYKACKSVEQLLATLNIITRNAAQLDS